MPSLRPQPLIAVADVDASSRWYQAVLGATSGHGGPEYEQLLIDDTLILQLHRDDEAHHHERIGDPALPKGNGVAVWFSADDFDGLVERVRAVDPELVTDVTLNPNSQQREIWIRDLDGYLVVLAEHRT